MRGKSLSYRFGRCCCRSSSTTLLLMSVLCVSVSVCALLLSLTGCCCLKHSRTFSSFQFGYLPESLDFCCQQYSSHSFIRRSSKRETACAPACSIHPAFQPTNQYTSSSTVFFYIDFSVPLVIVVFHFSVVANTQSNNLSIWSPCADIIVSACACLCVCVNFIFSFVYKILHINIRTP